MVPPHMIRRKQKKQKTKTETVYDCRYDGWLGLRVKLSPVLMQTYNHVNIKNSPKLIISRVFVIELYFERPNRSGVLIISYMTTEPCVRWTDAGGVYPDRCTWRLLWPLTKLLCLTCWELQHDDVFSHIDYFFTTGFNQYKKHMAAAEHSLDFSSMTSSSKK